MNQKTRYPLILGLVITIFELGIFCLGHFASLKVEYDNYNLILFFMSAIPVVLCFPTFKYYKMPTKILKTHHVKPWLACIFSFLYWTYLLVVFCLKEYNNKVIAFSHLLIIGLAILLMIIGNTMKIFDENLKIKYENQDNN